MSDEKKKPKAMLALTGPVIEKYFSGKPRRREPRSVEDLIRQNKMLAQQKMDSGDERWEWEFVQIMADRATAALETGDTFYLCFEIYSIGRHVEKLLLLDPDLQREVAKALKASQSRKAGFLARKYKREDVKVLAQREARQLWNADSEKELLIGEVSKLVIDELHIKLGKELLKLIPKKETMRKWLRPLAPEYATRHGRPRTPKN